MEATLAAATRATRGKNESRRLRRNRRMPAVVYGGASEGSVAVTVDPKAVLRILHSESGMNTLVDLQVDDGAPGRVLIKDVQVDPTTNELLHADFYRVALDQVITVSVPVTLSGEAEGVKQQGGLVDFVTRDVQIECLPTEIPEHIAVDVTPLRIGDGVRLREVAEGVSWTAVSDLDTLLVHVTAAKVEAEPEAEAAEAEAGEGEPAAADDAEGGERET